jgi:protein involved in polysaccharide export with SLBB domain
MLKKPVRIYIILSAITLLLGVTFSASAEDGNGYMDRMLKAMSGQEAAEPAPDLTAQDSWVDEASQREIDSASGHAALPPPAPLLPETANSNSEEPLEPLSALESPEPMIIAAHDDDLFERAPQDIQPSSGSTIIATPTGTTEPAAAEPTEETVLPAPSGSDGTLNVGDLLRITVFGVEELTNTYRIDAKGILTVPLVGELQAKGKTREELQSEIAQSLIEGGYYNSPSVTVEIMELSPFYILGEVKNPGRYPYEPELDIFKAIAIAGGYTPRAAKDKVIIIRNIGGRKTEIEATESTEILPGDSIKVKQRFF